MKDKLPFSLVVTGSGTDVGKSIVSAHLLRGLLRRDCRVGAVKIVQTGVEGPLDPSSDAALYRRMTSDLPLYREPLVLENFLLPASPHLAARREGRRLTVAALLAKIYEAQSRASDCDFLLLETAGGLAVPLNEEEDMLELMRELGFPVLFTFANGLGALNHVQLSLAALARAHLPVFALIANEATLALSSEELLIREDNVALLKDRLAVRSPKTLLVRLPHTTEPDALDCALDPIMTAMIRAGHSSKQNDTGADLVARDRDCLWHPYASAKSNSPLFPVRETYKNRLLLADGRELIDGMSSWWCAVHGYRHPHILAALERQAKVLPHVMFGGLTHEPAVLLGERLRKLLPAPLARIFFADSGSVSVEVALKMALQYQAAKKESQRTRFLSLMGGYHGDTTGAMSVCDPVNGMHSLFRSLLPEQIFLPRPPCRFDRPFDSSALAAVEDTFRRHGHEIAAVILEPVVQGAGGMWFYHPDYLNALATLARSYGCLLIYDEIATGFGHTGKFFALQWTETVPDLICIGKALTGGTMTLAATVCTDEVADTISAAGQVLMHGPTFMANPLACAAAHASLDILERGEWQDQVAGIEKALTCGLAPCRKLANVSDVRVLGDIGVVETREKVDADFLTFFCVEHGVWIRPFNHLFYIMPPYITPARDITRLTEVMYEGLLALMSGKGSTR